MKGKTRIQYPGIRSIQIIVAIVLLTGSGCCKPSFYTIPPLTKQTPKTVEISGSKRITPGAWSYYVTVTFDKPLSTTRNYAVLVDIYEDDTFDGDVQLVDNVSVPINANATSGMQSFLLTCYDPGDGDLDIIGDFGLDDLEDSWHVYGKVEDQAVAEKFSGGNMEIICDVP